jgi:hypothetical protein
MSDAHDETPAEHDLREQVQAELAALADGTLPAARRARALADVQSSPARRDALEHQRATLASMRALESVRAPAALRASIEQLTSEAAQPSSARRRPALARLRLIGATALAACVLAAAVLALSAGTSHQPTVLQAARLALGPATLRSPAENPHARGLLERSVEGVAYPYWGGPRGWATAGARTDRLGGRTVTTVFYAARDGARIGYAIVAGRPLAIPRGGSAVQWGQRRFRVLAVAGANVVTWREDGHTCILAARGVAPHTLLALVS